MSKKMCRTTESDPNPQPHVQHVSEFRTGSEDQNQSTMKDFLFYYNQIIKQTKSRKGGHLSTDNNSPYYWELTLIAINAIHTVAIDHELVYISYGAGAVSPHHCALTCTM